MHFKPLIRPHTDPSLGHCSYLNTCYSEPTYAQSPSIPPFPGSTHNHGMVPPNTRGPSSLPSGLGAGGRGKDKAPCRYLHYEVDWTEADSENRKFEKKEVARKRLHRLGIGLGPNGKDTSIVRRTKTSEKHNIILTQVTISSLPSGLTVMSAASTILCWGNFTLSWPIHPGISI